MSIGFFGQWWPLYLVIIIVINGYIFHLLKQTICGEFIYQNLRNTQIISYILKICQFSKNFLKCKQSASNQSIINLQVGTSEHIRLLSSI